MKMTEAMRKMMEIEKKSGIQGVGEIENVGKLDRSKAIKAYGRLIIPDDKIDEEIEKRQAEEKEIFGNCRPADEIRAVILRENAEYQRIIETAEKNAEKDFRVIF